MIQKCVQRRLEALFFYLDITASVSLIWEYQNEKFSEIIICVN